MESGKNVTLGAVKKKMSDGFRWIQLCANLEAVLTSCDLGTRRCCLNANNGKKKKKKFV